MEELQKKIAEIKSLCEDRMDAITADGNKLNKVFKEVEELVAKLIKKQ